MPNSAIAAMTIVFGLAYYLQYYSLSELLGHNQSSALSAPRSEVAMRHRNPQKAFENFIMSLNKDNRDEAIEHVCQYMYMHSEACVDMFKHKDTREYTRVLNLNDYDASDPVWGA
jgi:hypothetical protein